MRIGVIPENLFDWIILKLNIVPTPLADTMIAFMFARSVMVATKLGIFEVLASTPLTAEEVAKICKTDPNATTKLLNALVGIGYLKAKGQQYLLKPPLRKWLLKRSDTSVFDKMLSNFVDWQLVEHYEEFMHTGKPLDFHQDGFMSPEQWSLYQGGMRSIAGISAKEVVKKIPVPENARDLLDIGGSHGFYSVGLCKRHNSLRAVILELPEAIEAARPLLEKENMGDRIQYRPGDAAKDDLGSGAWDVVFISNLVHHFDLATNRDIAKRVFKSLRPGGTFTILEPIRPHSPEAAQKARLGALFDFFFAVTSQSGTWTIEEMAGWQRDAGFVPQKPKSVRSMPGFAQISAQKEV